MPKQVRSFRTTGLIIKRRNFGEADRLLTILTPAHGKIQALAKGARKPTSRKTGHVELFTQVDLLINVGRNLDIVSQAEMTEPYQALREDLQRTAYASYIAELTDRMTLDNDADTADVFDWLALAFGWLCETNDLRLTVRYFEIHLLDAVGFRPELTECVFTREMIQPEDQFFSYAEGGVVSPQAAHFAQTIQPIDLDTLKVLRHLQRSPFAQVRTLILADALHINLERLLLGYITYLLESRLQSVDFIRRIR
jgi:DNA repair protein RecO (recombination protein O)